MLLLENNRPD